MKFSDLTNIMFMFEGPNLVTALRHLHWNQDWISWQCNAEYVRLHDMYMRSLEDSTATS